MGIPSLFGPEKEINVVYTWVDVASATGYISYDCYSAVDSVSIKRILIESSARSELNSVAQYVPAGSAQSITSANVGGGGAWVKGLGIDWDGTAFTQARTIKGTAYFNFFYLATGSSYSSYVIVKVRKWDGATETEIASVQSPTTAAATVEIGTALSVEIPQTKFKVGDQLRITTEVWGQKASGTFDLSIAGDPADAATTDGNTMSAGNTRIISVIPYKIEV